MVQPVIIPRSAHTISRSLIDPDALKVLYRLHRANHFAYLVGGGVRDLLLGRHPKDFDIGTSAHPHDVKRLFRNCWIIGRRFRLAHIKFGPKTIEVATFRRQVAPEELAAHTAESAQVPGNTGTATNVKRGSEDPRRRTTDQRLPDIAGAEPPARRPIRHENTFGTPEEDAFRRDFTINALFYDIGTFSLIDYVGGLEDLRAGLVRCIGDPEERFVEDPVRMLRAIALGARLTFSLDPPIYEAISRHRRQIVHASSARVIEELYKVLRSGAALRTMRQLAEVGLLEHIAPELAGPVSNDLWVSLARLDEYRSRFDVAPPTLTNPILLGSLIVPVLPLSMRPRGETDERGRREASVSLGALPIARRDLERLRQIVGLQPRLLRPDLPQRLRRALTHRSAFRDALTWTEIHAGAPGVVESWREVAAGVTALPVPSTDERRRRRRPRRRRRRRRAGEREPLH